MSLASIKSKIEKTYKERRPDAGYPDYLDELVLYKALGC